MVSLLNAFVDVREVGTESGDGFQDSRTYQVSFISKAR